MSPVSRASTPVVSTSELSAGKVVIVTGFQGINETNDVTTLGRGGSDITGAALAAALDAEACEICTDVDGVFSADPSRVPGARLWREISYEEAIEMASSGAKVLHPRAAEVCMEYDVPIHVRSSFHLRDGTWIRGGGDVMERAEVVSVTSDSKVAKVTLQGCARRAGDGGTRVSGSRSSRHQHPTDHSERQHRCAWPHHVHPGSRIPGGSEELVPDLGGLGCGQPVRDRE